MGKYKVLEWWKDRMDDLYVERLSDGHKLIVDVIRDGTFPELPDGKNSEDFDTFMQGLVGKTLEITELTPATYYGYGVKVL